MHTFVISQKTTTDELRQLQLNFIDTGIPLHVKVVSVPIAAFLRFNIPKDHTRPLHLTFTYHHTFDRYTPQYLTILLSRAEKISFKKGCKFDDINSLNPLYDNQSLKCIHIATRYIDNVFINFFKQYNHLTSFDFNTNDDNVTHIMNIYDVVNSFSDRITKIYITDDAPIDLLKGTSDWTNLKNIVLYIRYTIEIEKILKHYKHLDELKIKKLPQQLLVVFNIKTILYNVLQIVSVKKITINLPYNSDDPNPYSKELIDLLFGNYTTEEIKLPFCSHDKIIDEIIKGLLNINNYSNQVRLIEQTTPEYKELAVLPLYQNLYLESTTSILTKQKVQHFLNDYSIEVNDNIYLSILCLTSLVKKIHTSTLKLNALLSTYMDITMVKDRINDIYYNLGMRSEDISPGVKRLKREEESSDTERISSMEGLEHSTQNASSTLVCF